MRRVIALCALLLVASIGLADAATIVIINADGAGEGFNDPTPAAPVGGNTGTTVGQQRLIVFQTAADIWGALLPSAVTIRVNAQFNPLSCTSTSAVLGSAGPASVYRDFPGAPVAGTWYHVALANKLAGTDLDVSGADISATFNSSLDGSASCLGGEQWYYGLDGNEGTNVELLPVLLHELGHGLGFSTLIGSNGVEFNGFQDRFEMFIRDDTQGTTWDNLTQGQRATSAINTGNVAWNGAFVTAHAPLYLGGTPTMFVNAGASLPATIALGLASFGGALTVGGVTGDIVLAQDGVGTTTDACDPLTNGAALNGNIALIDRGSCTFVSKALAAQAAGAIAVVIADNVAGSTPPGLGGTDPSITIPVVSITQADGNAIKAALPGVNVTLALDANHLAGTDSGGRVLLYAPSPYQSGSSISHWDVSAYPDLLMEPAINNGLSSSVDLTLAAFADLGWLTSLPTGTANAPAPFGVSALSNYPNPFNPATTIEYTVSPGQHVDLAVYDVRGHLVRSLRSGWADAGPYNVAWDGQTNRGQPAVSGVYYIRLTGQFNTMTRKIVLLK